MLLDIILDHIKNLSADEQKNLASQIMDSLAQDNEDDDQFYNLDVF